MWNALTGWMARNETARAAKAQALARRLLEAADHARGLSPHDAHQLRRAALASLSVVR